MCIIVVKPQGKEPLPVQTISACWENNPDGAGFVIHKPGHDSLLIQKGFMALDLLLDALDASDIHASDTVIYHFRIATSGGITPANYHPFPISDKVKDLKTLTIACKIAFVHNGILGKGSKDLSDTQLYVLNTLSRYGSIKGNLHKIRKDTAGSRTAILNADGQLWLTGHWIEKDGYHFSNETYTYQNWWYGFEWYDTPDTCERCHSKQLLVKRNGILFCDHCHTGYVACYGCGEWQAIRDMEICDDEEGNEVPICFSCLNERGPDNQRSSYVEDTIDRLLRC